MADFQPRENNQQYNNYSDDNNSQDFEENQGDDVEETRNEPPEEKPSVVENIKDTISRPMESIKEKTQGVTESVKLFSNTRTGITILTLVVGIAILILIGIIIYWLIRNKVVNRNTYLLEESKIPIVCTSVKQLDGTGIPNAGNGKRLTVSFWIYIYNPEYNPGARKHVLHRGTKDESILTASPYIYLDETSNKLHVLFGPSKSEDKVSDGKGNSYDDTASPAKNYLTQNSKIKLAQAVRGITIDYIPVQRWVHVAIVTNESVNSGSFTAYLDGELVKVKNAATELNNIPLDGTTSTAISPLTNPIVPGFNITNLDLDHKGDVYVGGGSTDSIGVGFSGMVSKIRFTNYDMNAQDIYAEYLNGPIDSLLAKMGLAAYGIRSPIYKIQ